MSFPNENQIRTLDFLCFVETNKSYRFQSFSIIQRQKEKQMYPSVNHH